jgi:osmotically-inducible protein OsmY
MKKSILISWLVLSSLTLSGCISVSQTASALYSVVSINKDRRTLGTIVDDKSIHLKLSNWSFIDKKLKEAHLNFMVYDKTVLITGEVPTKRIQLYLNTEILNRFELIQKVFNETKVASNSSFFSRTKDTGITAQVETLLFNQEVFHPSHVRVMTENGVVYLMGALTKREANVAAKRAARASGAYKVVKIFDYLATRPRAEIERERAKASKKRKEIEQKRQRKIIEAKKAELRRQIKALDPNAGTSFSPL